MRKIYTILTSFMILTLQNIMQDCMGIARDADSLQYRVKRLSQWQQDNVPAGTSCKDQTTTALLNSIYAYQTDLLAKLGTGMVQSTLLRKESRGAHYRTDFPQTDPSLAKPIIMEYTRF